MLITLSLVNLMIVGTFVKSFSRVVTVDVPLREISISLLLPAGLPIRLKSVIVCLRC